MQIVQINLPIHILQSDVTRCIILAAWKAARTSLPASVRRRFAAGSSPLSGIRLLNLKDLI